MLREPEVKYFICDMPNTLFDSRHRIEEIGPMITGIKDDKLNYSCYILVKTLIDAGYKPIFTHYMLSRKKQLALDLLKKHHLHESGKLYVNFNSQEVYSGLTLKKYLLKKLEDNDIFVEYAIDNSKDAETFWLKNDIALINVPLPIC